MPTFKITTLLLSALLASAPALAATTTHDEKARLEWRDGNHHLVMDADNGIVRVISLEPASDFGVRSGDRILRIDGQPVRRIDDLTAVLTRSRSTRLPLTLLRKGSESSVEINTAPWRKVLSAEPAPAPPAPPAPPRPRG